jgi:hypothetical protein
MSSRWILVRWGEERFLVPDCQMIAFCNNVNSRGWFQFPRRIVNDDWHLHVEPPETPPRVPDAYRLFLLGTPIETGITACSDVVELARQPDAEESLCLVTAQVGVGSRAGLLPGMALHALRPARGTGEVVEVDEETASVEFRFWRHLEDAPQAGWKLSTRPARRE